MEKLLIIDSNSLINRAFYGVRYLSAPDGTPTNAIYGFLMMLLKLIEEEKPDYIMAAFDLKAPTFRHKMYSEYKANRKGMPDDLATQMPYARRIIDEMGILRLEKEGYEADDIIGTVSRLSSEKGIKCMIATGDKDDLQLACDKCSVLLTVSKNGNTETTEYTPDKVFERYGVTPSEFIDVKALMGDSSDNIPGVAGIGEKTAIELIKEFKSIENIYEDFDAHGFKGAKLKKLQAGRDMAFLSKQLATIDKNVPIDISFDNAKGYSPSGELYNTLRNLGLNSVIKRMDFSGVEKAEEAHQNPIEGKTVEAVSDIDAFKAKIKNAGEIAVKFDIADGRVRALAFALENTGYIVDKVSDFYDILADENIKKITTNSKEAYTALSKETKLAGVSYDVEIAAYLINPSRSEYSLDTLSIEYFGMSPLEKAEKQVSLFDDEEQADDNLAKEALLLYPIHEKTLAKLKDLGQESLYFDIELPLTEVLADMQTEGMYVDRESLESFGRMLSQRIEALTKEIYELSGTEFNINSPKQLGEILFEKLGLPSKKKTKKGYSTGAEILENLIDKHPIIPSILEYRQLSKLKSTYCDGLTAVINEETGRIHSVFTQTVTVTGRISSTEPNMQNIPTRTELGREIRKMFVAENGKIFVDADYSQIELRVLAAISNDEAMKNAFLSGNDIHTETASEVLKIPAEKVTKEQRSSAKAVNFGIVYGISEFSLAKDLKISVKEARDYITSYLAHYKGVREYMEKIKAEAKEKGCVKTLMNRIRYIPELKNSNYNIRMFGERVALNTPIQGTAADIIKLAMVKVYRRLKNDGLKSKLILQVHDELIIETFPEEEEKVRQILKEEMENAVSIGVPLIADIESGRSWYDCK
ncbi:MAG: DNA polymerase I [Clostridia bacterium]|nr:DNA polymerase I [Clostridia bacterium]